MPLTHATLQRVGTLTVGSSPTLIKKSGNIGLLAILSQFTFSASVFRNGTGLVLAELLIIHRPSDRFLTPVRRRPVPDDPKHDPVRLAVEILCGGNATAACFVVSSG